MGKHKIKFMKNLLFLIIGLPFFLNAQLTGPHSPGKEDRGVHFEQGLSWEQVKEKAKAENKYIFIDCFATWCGPCKQMDRDVYPKENVGNYMMGSFISVRVQMDTSKKDEEEVKNWYAAAHVIQEKYKITALPSFLFFSPAGELVHEAIGAMSADEFILTATDAANPNKQYFTLLENYRQGKKDYRVMPLMANTAKVLKDNEMGIEIAKDYMHNYLDKLDDTQYCTKENFDFIGSFFKMVNSNDKIFSLYYHHPGKADGIMRDKGYSKRYVDDVIYR